MVKIKFNGSRINEFNGKINPDFSGKLSIETNIEVKSLDLVENNKEMLKANYSFTVDYKELGSIFIKGIIFISSDAKTIKELQKMKKDQLLENEDYVFLTNIIIQKASIKAFEIEDELGLPVHIKLPSLGVKK